MNISGIRTYAGFYDYNTIKDSETKSLQVQQMEPPTAQSAPEEEADRQQLSLEPQRQNGPDTGAMDFANRYQPDATYELKGVDSDVMSLDVEKAISDMKKDQVIQQYQFFVGESRAAEGLMQIRENENFSL